MTTSLRRLQLRIERSCERLDVSYPWWMATYSALAAVAIAVGAWLQRGGIDAPATTQLALALSIYPTLVWIPRAWLTPPLVEAATAVLAVCLFMVESPRPDLAPLLFLIIAGEVAAMSRVWVACVVAAVDVAVVLVAGSVGHLANVGLYVVGIVLAGDVGIALRWQMRALRAERANAGIAQERAILGERQRLAREVHDVVGHSLSINLLHVTAARHALQKHADIADAIESLTEAERVGRAAMGDLRRTVAVLAAGPGESHALPGVADIAELVDSSRAAGLDVRYACTGDQGPISAAAGLGLYRIVQESLGNVARHAPAARAVVELAVRDGEVSLVVRNTLPDVPAPTGDGGTGLPGMAARAEQMGAELRVGVVEGRWCVDVTLPLDVAVPTAVR